MAFNDAIGLLLLRVPRWHSASQLFVNCGVPTLGAPLRQLMYKFMSRLDKSKKTIIKGIN